MQLLRKMFFLFWLPSYLYQDVYNWAVIIIAAVLIFKYPSITNERIVRGKEHPSPTPLVVLSLFLIILIGFRPISYTFGDMALYYRDFEIQSRYRMPFDTMGASDYGWYIFQDIWRVVLSGQSSYVQFEAISFTCTLIYVGCTAGACWRIDRRHAFPIFIFVLSCFSFFTYATNGMRNGVACAITLLALSFMIKGKRGIIWAALLVIIGMSFHKSVALPGLCMFVSYYLIKNIKVAIAFWLICILLSILIGKSVESLVMGIGFDDRLSNYIESQEDTAAMQRFFSKTGFRWDFLLYSCVPIVVGWFTVMTRSIKDKTYMVLLNTYILSNAFWVIVIRAMNSNRFAYLSWFMYGIVLAYPLLNFKVFKNQGGTIAIFLLYQIGFLLFMS